MKAGNGYHLVHVVSNGEFMAPLIATQVFDRAQAQATVPGENKPLSVSVWVVEPIKYVFDKEAQAHLAEMRKRCPGVQVKLMGGLSRLKNWPSMLWLGRERRILGKSPVVYHCRGEATFSWGEKIAAKRAGDSVVVDIRGFWPLERLASQGVFDPGDIDHTQQAVFDADVKTLQYAISHSNMVTTVSAPLKDYLVQNYNAPDNTGVIPCCVTNAINDSQRDDVRGQLTLGDKKAILYLGGTQTYQHLEDLVFPFFQSALKQSENYVAVFITQNMAAMQQLVEKFRLPEERVRLISVPQQEVGKYLSAMDAGLLLRAPSFLNAFSQPVKLGEYLSAGLPVVVERGTGNVEEMLAAYDIAFAVNIHNRSAADLDAEVGKTLNWIQESNLSRRDAARGFVEQYYTWKANVQRERRMYTDSLANTTAKPIKRTL